MKPGYALGLTLSLCISTAPIAAQTARMAHPSLPLRSPLALRPDRCHPPLDATQPQYVIGYGSLMDHSVTPQGQIWIYVVPPDRVATPSADFPIVQSYVDIMLGGCLEIEKNFAIAQFAEMCVTTTTGWSQHWVNDRIYPRRPFIYQPRSREIDQMLGTILPDLLPLRKIE